MTEIIEQLIGLTGRIINSVFDWPFLGFVLLLWMVTRYRNQIGSFLDRRGTVPAGEISKAVKENLDPISGDLLHLRAAIMEIRHQMRRFDALESEYPRARMVESANMRISSAEEALSKLQVRIEGINHNELPELLTRGVQPIKNDLNSLRTDFESIRSDFGSFASSQSVARLEAASEALSKDLAELKKVLGAATAKLESVAVREEVLTLESSLATMKAQVSGLGESLATIQAQVNSSASAESVAELRNAFQPISSGMSSLTENLDKFKADVEKVHSDLAAYASKEAVERAQAAIQTVETQLEALTGSLGVLQAKTENLVSSDTANRIEAELESVKSSLADSGKLAGDMESIDKKVETLRLSVELLTPQLAEADQPASAQPQARAKDGGKKKHKSKGMALNR